MSCSQDEVEGLYEGVLFEFEDDLFYGEEIPDLPITSKKTPDIITYNASPGQYLWVIYNDDPTHFRRAKWGLIPSWSPEPKSKYSTINAKSETAPTSPAFRGPFQKKHCLVLADSFFEWPITNQGKIPVRIFLKSRKLFTFAGLWDEWKNKDDNKILRTFTILTTEPNVLMKPIHNRMPVILAKHGEQAWLDNQTDPKEFNKLLQPYPPKDMDFYAISGRVGSPRNNDPAILEPVNIDIKSLLSAA